MSNLAPKVPIKAPRSPFVWFLIFILYMIMAAFSTSFLIGQLLNYIFNGSTEASFNFLIHPEQFPDQETLYISIQAIASMLLFIGGTWFFLKRENGPLLFKLTNKLNNYKSNSVIIGCLITLIVFPISFLIEDINVAIIERLLPANLQELVVSSQEATKTVYAYLLSVPNIGILLLSVVGLAIIPAIGEELVFRGVLQNLFHRSLKNSHLTIWLTAFIFAIFHGNWDGFMVRLLLGALFGYFYNQTKNIYVPIAAHALNNSASLILGYLITNNILKISFDYSFIEAGTWPWLVVYSSLIITLAFILSKKHQTKKFFINEN